MQEVLLQTNIVWVDLIQKLRACDFILLRFSGHTSHLAFCRIKIGCGPFAMELNRFLKVYETCDLTVCPVRNMVGEVGFEPTQPEGGRFTVCCN